MGPVIAALTLGLAIITMVGLTGWVHNTRKTAKLEAAAKARLEQEWAMDNWHFRTYGWVPVRQPAVKEDNGWFVFGWWG